MKIDKSSKDKLIDRILVQKQAFKEKYGSDPMVVLLSRKNFLALRAWQKDMQKDTSSIHGMLPLLDNQVDDIFVGGM